MTVSRTIVELIVAFANLRPDQREKTLTWFKAEDEVETRDCWAFSAQRLKSGPGSGSGSGFASTQATVTSVSRSTAG